MILFEKVSRIPGEITLPKRATANSAGYDFYAPEEVILPAKQLTRVMTGVKCQLPIFMFLMLANRSSNPSKKNLFLANGVGIVDADYYNNPDNEGEIGFEFYNNSDEDVVIAKDEKIGQGIINQFIKADNDVIANSDTIRVGGFGSTGDK